MKILHYVNESMLAWARPYIQLILALQRQGTSNKVLCAPAGTLPGLLSESDIEHDTDKPLFPWLPAACPGIGRRIAREKPDIIVTRLSSASAIGGYWGRRLGIPVIGVLDKFSKRKYYKNVDAVQAVSTALQEYAIKENFPSPFFIPNGIETGRYARDDSLRASTRRQYGIEDADRVIVAAGRFVRWKGFDVALKAFSLLQKKMEESSKNSRLRLILAGDGEERHALEEMAGDMKRNGSVIFTGFVQDIRPVLWASDIFVLPSREAEPFGLILLEAMASGLPVIATDFGGPRDMLKHNEAGWLVPPEDPEALAHTLHHTLSASNLVEKGRKALEASKRFEIDRIAGESLGVYEGLLRERKRMERPEISKF